MKLQIVWNYTKVTKDCALVQQKDIAKDSAATIQKENKQRCLVYTPC